MPEYEGLLPIAHEKKDTAITIGFNPIANSNLLLSKT